VNLPALGSTVRLRDLTIEGADLLVRRSAQA
jgi:hypothetical protein